MKKQIAPYNDRYQSALFSLAALSVLKDLFSPLLLPCRMTFVLTYVVSNPLALLKKALISFHNVPTYDFAIDRLNAIFHTRLRSVDTCPLDFYRFEIGCRENPACLLWFPQRDS